MADIKTVIPAGGTVNLKAAGDFLFVKFCEREVFMDIKDREGRSDGKTAIITGDFRRPPSGVNEIDLENPNPDAPVAVVLYVGFGEFDRRIIQGEITVNPGLRNAAGQWVDDTTTDFDLRVSVGNTETYQFAVEETVESAPIGVPRYDISGWMEADDGRVFLMREDKNTYVSEDWPNKEFKDTGLFLGHGPGLQIGRELIFPEGYQGYVRFNVFDAATLKARRTIYSGIKWGGSGQNPQLKGMVLLPTGLIAVSHDSGEGNNISIVDQSGNVVKRIETDISFLNGGIIEKDGYLMASSGRFADGYAKAWDARTLEPVPFPAGVVPNDAISELHLMAADKRYWFTAWSGDLLKVAIEQFKITATGTAAGCGAARMFKETREETSANIYVERVDAGTVLMSGETIRACLEFYAGRPVRLDYLDFVYAFKAENINGFAGRKISAGGQSFLAAGIEDDFVMEFPQRVTLTLREGIFE